MITTANQMFLRWRKSACEYFSDVEEKRIDVKTYTQKFGANNCLAVFPLKVEKVT